MFKPSVILIYIFGGGISVSTYAKNYWRRHVKIPNSNFWIWLFPFFPLVLFCFIYSEALLLDGYTFRIVMPSQYIELLKIIYLFLERGEGSEKERERNIYVWLPLLGTWPTTQACALTRNWIHDPLVLRLALKLLSYTSQGRTFSLK